ncbi:MAG: CopG family transcriptional regulator [Myxococcales bacterium]|nr:CopG family transcriptional regulator [Myxococcales bacterium]
MPADKVTLKIPRPLYDNLKQSIQGTGFSSVNEFVVYVLRDLTSGLKPKGRPSRATRPVPAALDARDARDSSGLTQAEIEIIRKRLHDLGYI